MFKHISKSIFLIFSIILTTLLFSCSDDKDTNPSENDSRLKALVIVVENSDGILTDEALNMAWQSEDYHLPAVNLLSAVFNVSPDKIDTMVLNDVVEIYGEQWQLESIAKAGDGHFDRTILLSDENSNKVTFITNLEELSEQDYIIDVVFCLHGSETLIGFGEESCLVSEMVDELKTKDIEIRSLYQTNCYGKFTIGEYESNDIVALNGAEEINAITLLSPAFFIEEWVGGLTFTEVVEVAYQRELDSLDAYGQKYGIPLGLFLTDENLTGSKQHFGGSNPNLLF